MTSGNSFPAIPQVTGPFRFLLAVRLAGTPARTEPGQTAEVVFIVNALTLPRVGERLAFDPERTSLQLRVTVTDVCHDFLTYDGPDEPGHRHFEVEATTADMDAFEKLQDAAVLKQWIAEFDMLEN